MNTFGGTVMLKSKNMNMFGGGTATNSLKPLCCNGFKRFPKMLIYLQEITQ